MYVPFSLRSLSAVIVGSLLLAACTQVPPAPEPAAPIITTPTPSPAAPATSAHPTEAVAPPVAAPIGTTPAQPTDPQARWTIASFAQLPSWAQDDLRDVSTAYQENCKGLRFKTEWQGLCARFPVAGSTAEIRAFFEREFVPYRLTRSDAEDKGLITGYYEPLLRGARHKAGPFTVPLYARPDDLLVIDLGDLYPELKGKRVRGRIVDGPTAGVKRVVPYFDRGQIEGNTNAFKPLVWVNDPVEAFFLQVQGSGMIDLGGGQRMRVGYADQNGHAYRSIGRVLIDRGELTLAEASMQGIKNWVAKNPAKAQALLNENPSYVFFREIDAAPAGPLGALGVPLTAERSIAVDTRYIPLGTPLFLATTQPNSSQSLNRLMFAQDVGGAIRGVVRGDFYWGTGAKAGDQAGRMKQNAQMWILWPKSLAPLR